MNLTNNKNSYYFGTDAARQGVGHHGTTAGSPNLATLAALAAYTSTLHAAATNDNASIASTRGVPYATNNDLHITSAAPEFNTGVTIASVTNDFDGDTRPQDGAYEIGADEVLGVPPHRRKRRRSRCHLRDQRYHRHLRRRQRLHRSGTGHPDLGRWRYGGQDDRHHDPRRRGV